MSETGLPPPETATPGRMTPHGSAYAIQPGENIFQTLGINEFTVERPEQPAEPWKKGGRKKPVAASTHTFRIGTHYGMNDGMPWPRSPYGPTTEELQAELKRALVKHRPDLLMSGLQQACSNNNSKAVHGSGQRKHYLHHTVPYDADSQPAELLWAVTKTRTAKGWFAKRTVEGVRKSWMTALYGGDMTLGIPPDPGERPASAMFMEPVGAKMCAGFIRKAQRCISDYLEVKRDKQSIVIPSTVTSFAELRASLPTILAEKRVSIDDIDSILIGMKPRNTALDMRGPLAVDDE